MAVAPLPWMIGVQDHYPLIPKGPSFSSYSLFHGPVRFSSQQYFRQIIRATSSDVFLEPKARTQSKEGFEVDLFACPVCYEPLGRKGPLGFNAPASYRSGFKCKTCNKTCSSKNMYLDLTVTSGSKDHNEFKPTGTELFSYEFTCFLLVWERLASKRQNFNRSGFPGPDEELKMAQEYLKPVEGGVLIDVSCGSGLFSRKFAAYSEVVALDFSENMLRQCYDIIRSDDSILNSILALLRADVSRLPFSIDCVHAGAALHCWPSPFNARARNYSYLTEEEIEALCTSCGLINYTNKVRQSFIIFSSQKP